MTGFLEEAPGVKSSTRLTIAELTGAVLGLSLAAAVVAVKGGEHAAAIIGALAGVILGLGASIVGAISQRNKGADPNA